MRTGPFSDPIVVALLNRYFVPVHLDNVDGSGVRYDMPPGHEDAYLILETPELPGGPEVETLILGRIENVRGPEAAVKTGVLEPPTVRRELRRFLDRHPDLHHPWPELTRVRAQTDPISRTRTAELLIDEGRLDEALQLLHETPAPPERAALLRARALRLQGAWVAAAEALADLARSAEVDIERIRLAFEQDATGTAARLLDEFLGRYASSADGAEAFYLRGLLYHRAGADEQALETWRRGLALHPPTQSLFGQKIELTRIRQNWELSAVVGSGPQ